MTSVPQPSDLMIRILHAICLADGATGRVVGLAARGARVVLPEGALAIHCVDSADDVRALVGVVQPVSRGWFALWVIGPAADQVVRNMKGLQATKLGHGWLIGREGQRYSRLIGVLRERNVHPVDCEASWRQLLAEASDAEQAAADIELFREGLESRPAVVTRVMCGVLAVIYLLEVVWGGAGFVPTLVRMGAVTGELVWAGEWWRLFTAELLHGSIVHVVLIILALGFLGTFLERLLGSDRFLILALASGVGGAIGSATMGGSVSVGASGALWGMLGACGVLAFHSRGLLPSAMIPRFREAFAKNLVFNLAISFLPGIDLWAHLGGGLVGVVLSATGILTYGLTRNDVDRRRALPAAPAPIRALAGVLIAWFAIAFGVAMWHGQPWLLASTPNMTDRSIGGGLEMSVPVALHAGDRSLLTDPSVKIFGDLLWDPWSVVAHVVAGPGAEAEFRAIESGGDVEAERRDAEFVESWRVDHGGLPGIAHRFVTSAGIFVELHAQLRGERLVVLEVYVLPGCPPYWEGARRHLLRSIRPE